MPKIHLPDAELLAVVCQNRAFCRWKKHFRWEAVGQAHVRNFFCTSRGAMCAGSAQVTLVEFRRSYFAGCKPNRRKLRPSKFLDSKNGGHLLAKIFVAVAKNSTSFDCFCRYATEVFHTAFFMVLQRREHVLHTLSNLVEKTVFFCQCFFGPRNQPTIHPKCLGASVELPV